MGEPVVGGAGKVRPPHDVFRAPPDLPILRPEPEHPRRTQGDVGRVLTRGNRLDLQAPWPSFQPRSTIPTGGAVRRHGRHRTAARPRGGDPHGGRRQAGGERLRRAADADDPRGGDRPCPSAATSPTPTAGSAGPWTTCTTRKSDPLGLGRPDPGRVRAAMAAGAEGPGPYRSEAGLRTTMSSHPGAYGPTRTRPRARPLRSGWSPPPPGSASPPDTSFRGQGVRPDGMPWG